MSIPLHLSDIPNTIFDSGSSFFFFIYLFFLFFYFLFYFKYFYLNILNILSKILTKIIINYHIILEYY